MDSIEQFLSEFILKAVHKAVPNASADDDAKVNKAIADFVTTAMDLAAVYFALRKDKSAATPATK